MTRRSPRRLLVAVAAAVATLGLAACSTHPGQAAVVGSTSISNEKVDALAATLCSVETGGQQSQQPQQPVASRFTRQGAVSVLVNNELSQQFGQDVGAEVDREQLSAQLEAQEPTVKALSGRNQEIFRETLRDFVEGQLLLVDVGTKALAEQGTTPTDPNQTLEAGLRLRNKWVEENVDVTIDPRYGTFTNGTFVPRSGSVSVPVSEAAKQAGADQPSEAWVSSLPASQTCR